MKKLLLLSFLFLLSFYHRASAQAPIVLKVDQSTNTITINNVQFTPASTIEDYEEYLGKPDRIEQKRGVDQYFAYDKLGISFSLEKDSDLISEIFITYRSDGDRKAAKEVFKGSLTVNGQPVQANATQKDLGKLFNTEFVEVMNGYFLSPKNTISFLLRYPEEAPYTSLKQFGIRLSAGN